jgi:hypothetical protein
VNVRILEERQDSFPLKVGEGKLTPFFLTQNEDSFAFGVFVDIQLAGFEMLFCHLICAGSEPLVNVANRSEQFALRLDFG